MPLRILFADDSMTAQNMGKKILTEAGYDVVAVSNGAAAVKKIAEQKPDIIILDVYMPGYSGLEVCEKVRASLETAKTPVLLTVGKMEPYKPEDANRVKADGVIIKPFEASDLLAIIKKFEERVGHAPPPPLVEQTVLLERRFVEDALSSAGEPHMDHHATGKTGSRPMVEVPDHMATSAAFSDLLGADPSHSGGQYGMNTPAPAFETSAVAPAPPVPATEYELPVSWRQEDEGSPVAGVPMMVESVPDATPVATEPRVEAVPVATEPSFDLVPVEAEPTPDSAPMPVELERFGEAAVPVEPVAEVAPISPEPRVEAVPVASAPSVEKIEAVPMETEPTIEVAPIVETAPIGPIVKATPEAVPIAEPAVGATPELAEPAHEPAPTRPRYIPVYREPELEASVHEVVPTAAPQVDEITIPREPALLQSAEEATRNTVADRTEPGLMHTLQDSMIQEPAIQEPSIQESSIQESWAQESTLHRPMIQRPMTQEPDEYFPVAETKPAEVAPVEAEARAESASEVQRAVPAASAAMPVESQPVDDLSRSSASDATADVTDFDFEARVAAAMAAYNQMPGAEPPLAPTEENPAISAEHAHSVAAMGADMDAASHTSPIESAAKPAEAVTQEASRREFEPSHSFEYYPPIRRVPEMPRFIDRPVAETPAVEPAALPVAWPGPTVAPAPPVAETATAPVAEHVPPPVPREEMTWVAPPSVPPEPAVVESPAPSAHHEAAVSAGLEAALPPAVAAAAEETGADHHTIAQVVSRVMERLKPELVEEIMRELKSKK